jgi:D-beta-D-heptose 7-phosphate kinase/D-beta-D-heptose 1-phosphate adenosyltransferase
VTDPLEPARLAATVERVRGELGGRTPTRLVVVGDVMLDRYVDGSSTRLSPEAPVPVVDVVAELDRLGGAANVAAGLAALGASVTLIGIVGDDERGARVRSLLDAVAGIDARLAVDRSRMTTTKERVRVDGRHLVRIDRERSDPPDAATTGAVGRAAQDALDGAHALVVSDYAKGAVAPALVDSLSGRPCTVVDPKHVDVERYRGADVLAPNRAEAIAAAASAGTLGSTPSLEVAVRGLQARLPGTALVVTCGPEGMVWSERPVERGAELLRVPSLAPRVTDVTGAGDSVVGGLAAALATGCDLADAIGLATAVAAVAVASPGTAAPGWDEIEALVRVR